MNLPSENVPSQSSHSTGKCSVCNRRILKIAEAPWSFRTMLFTSDRMYRQGLRSFLLQLSCKSSSLSYPEAYRRTGRRQQGGQRAFRASLRGILRLIYADRLCLLLFTGSHELFALENCIGNILSYTLMLFKRKLVR